MEYFYQENKSYKDYKNQHYLYGLELEYLKCLVLKGWETLIGIVNCGSGNIHAIQNIYKRLNIDTCIIEEVNSLI